MSLGCVYHNGVCDKLNERTKVKRLNERDLSLSTSISSVYVPGIDLNTVIFDNKGYIANSTNYLLEALDAGLRRLYLDVYYDEIYGKWHLCPYRPPAVAQVISTPGNHTTTSFYTLYATTSAPIPDLTINSANVATDGERDAYQRYKTPLKRNYFGNSTTNQTVTFGNTTNQASCDYVLDLKLFVDKIQSYLDLSDTNIAASLLYLHLRPKKWPILYNYTVTSPYSFGQSSINSTFSPIRDRILSPAKNARRVSHGKQKKSTQSNSRLITTTKYSANPGPVTTATAKIDKRTIFDDTVSDDDYSEDEDYGDPWPSLRTFLYVETDRLIITYTPNSLNGTPDAESIHDIAFSAVPTIKNPSAHTMADLASLNFTDTFVNSATDWHNVTQSGVSPVINGSSFDIYGSAMHDLLNNYTDWAWAADQPILYSIQSRENVLRRAGTKSTELPACAVFTNSGMAVANCYAHFPVLCKHKSNPLDWLVSEDKTTYFSANCPSNYDFGVPETPLEARYVRERFFHPGSALTYAWVDFNSLFYPNCWVNGGPTAVCPYNVVEDGRNGIGFIAAAGAVAAVIGLLTVWFEWDRRRTPLLRNYKRGKTTRAAEFEGIPS